MKQLLLALIMFFFSAQKHACGQQKKVLSDKIEVFPGPYTGQCSVDVVFEVTPEWLRSCVSPNVFQFPEENYPHMVVSYGLPRNKTNGKCGLVIDFVRTDNSDTVKSFFSSSNYFAKTYFKQGFNEQFELDDVKYYLFVESCPGYTKSGQVVLTREYEVEKEDSLTWDVLTPEDIAAALEWESTGTSRAYIEPPSLTKLYRGVPVEVPGSMTIDNQIEFSREADIKLGFDKIAVLQREVSKQVKNSIKIGFTTGLVPKISAENCDYYLIERTIKKVYGYYTAPSLGINRRMPFTYFYGLKIETIPLCEGDSKKATLERIYWANQRVDSVEQVLFNINRN